MSRLSNPSEPDGTAHNGLAARFGGSTERKGVGLDPGIEKLDLERAIGNCAVLPNELVQTLSVDHALTVGVGVGAVICAWCRAVDGHAELDRLAVRGGTEHEM